MDDFDRILSDDTIVPSSGFTVRVMDTVRREAIVPPSMPFPWKRLVIAPALALIVVVAVVIQSGGFPAASSANMPGASIIEFQETLLASPRVRSIAGPLGVTVLTIVIASVPMLLRRRSFNGPALRR
jgi:hypothetical protein